MGQPPVTRRRIVVVTVFGFAGLLSGVTTVVAIRAADASAWVVPGLTLAVGIFTSIKACQGLGTVAPVPTRKFVAAMGMVAASYPPALLTLIVIDSLCQNAFYLAAGFESYNRSDFYPFAGWAIGLCAGALAMAALVSASLTVLATKENKTIRFWLLLGSLLVALTAVATDAVVVYRWNLPFESETRKLTALATMFVLGHFVFSLLYGFGVPQVTGGWPSHRSSKEG